MSRLEDYIKFSEEVEGLQTNEQLLLKTVKGMLDELSKYDVLETHSLRTLREAMALLREYADRRYPNEKGRIHKTFVEMLVWYHFGMILKVPPEYLEKIRDAILTGRLDFEGVNEEEEEDKEFPSVPFNLGDSGRTLSKFKKVISSLYNLVAYRGRDISGYYVGVMGDTVSMQVFLKALKNSVGIDRRTIEKWLWEFYNESFIDIRLKRVTKEGDVVYVPLPNVVREIRKIVSEWVGEYSRRGTGKSKKARIRSIRKLLSNYGLLDINYSFARRLYEICEVHLEEIHDGVYEKVDNEILKALFKYFAHSNSSLFVVSPFGRAIYNVDTRDATPFAVLYGRFEGSGASKYGSEVYVYGYALSKFKVEHNKVMRIFIFESRNPNGEISSLLGVPPKRYFIVFGDSVRMFDLVYKEVIPEIERKYRVKLVKTHRVVGGEIYENVFFGSRRVSVMGYDK